MPLPGSSELVFTLRYLWDNSAGCAPFVHCRQSSRSTDGGVTWSEAKDEPSLPDPCVKGGIATSPPHPNLLNSPGVMYLVNDRDGRPAKRDNVTLSVSTDGGRTWPDDASVRIYAKYAGYADVIGVDGGAVTLFEIDGCGQSAAFVRRALTSVTPKFYHVQ